MELIRRCLRRLWLLGLLLLGVSVGGTGWILHSRAGAGQSGAKPKEEAPPSSSLASVACFGHVDVEDGITSLYPSQPGRVERVNVKEGQEVKAGAVLSVWIDAWASTWCSRLALT